MGERLPPEETSQGFFQRLLKSPRSRLILIALLSLFLVFFFWQAVYLKKPPPTPEIPIPISPPVLPGRQEALTTKGKFPQEEIVVKVGKENLYGRDLNYKLFIYFPEILGLEGEVPAETKEKILDQIIEDSILLQTGEEMELFELNETVFNHPDKNYPERNKLINLARDKLPSQVVDQIDGEAISIWFYNTEPPEMGVEEAKRITYAKMTKIYEDITGGEISLKEAGERIASDKELEKIDFAFKTNAYVTFAGVERGNPIIHDPELVKILWTLKEGEISSILTGHDFGADGGPYEAYFLVFKVNRRSFADFSSFEEWLKAERKNYEIEILI